MKFTLESPLAGVIISIWAGFCMHFTCILASNWPHIRYLLLILPRPLRSRGPCAHVMHVGVVGVGAWPSEPKANRGVRRTPRRGSGGPWPPGWLHCSPPACWWCSAVVNVNREEPSSEPKASCEGCSAVVNVNNRGVVGSNGALKGPYSPPT